MTDEQLAAGEDTLTDLAGASAGATHELLWKLGGYCTLIFSSVGPTEARGLLRPRALSLLSRKLQQSRRPLDLLLISPSRCDSVTSADTAPRWAPSSGPCEGTRTDARIFRGLFTTPFLARIHNSRPVEVKLYIDPYPAFTAAKARGDTYMVVRNVPIIVKAEGLRESLLGERTEADHPWLADILHFHRLKDPYDGSAYSQILGLPVAAEGDPSFERISAILLDPGTG
ncbi:unnamed protein product [Closterium sp. NIES-64]|nr:unnamed protein product [Closterium sp. NIES-64]